MISLSSKIEERSCIPRNERMKGKKYSKSTAGFGDLMWLV